MLPIEQIKSTLLSVAVEKLAVGPGFAQDEVVLRETGQKLGAIGNTQYEQKILDAWYGLFNDGTLTRGYNLSNPSYPFFHQST